MKGKQLEGFIIFDEMTTQVKGYEASGWTPSESLVLSLEDKLIAFINNHPSLQNKNSWILEHLFEYKLQYFGYFRNNNKLLGINFHHESTSAVKDGLWKKGLIGVLGGGNLHFTVTYDIANQSFEDLNVNAPL